MEAGPFNSYNYAVLAESTKTFKGQLPFDHCITDNLFVDGIAHDLEKEFPDFDSNVWDRYDNAIEIKKACNNWNVFPPLTYRVASFLSSEEFTKILSKLLDIPDLSADPGLNGGGWHIHANGGKLNPHLDYSIHPKLHLQRKLNLIIYLNSQWRPEWGGQLGLWGSSKDPHCPGQLVKSVDPLFNRAILFDTTQNSWHGLPNPITCPAGQARKSLAIYYLVPPPENVDQRGKALFAPTEQQKNDSTVLELIKKRASTANAPDVYRYPWTS